MDIELSEDIAPEYLEDVWNILTNSEFLRLSQYVHHHWTNRFMHSLNVSYLSWLIAGKLGCDARAAARAGLLHDFCPYDFKAVTPTGESQAYYQSRGKEQRSALWHQRPGAGSDFEPHVPSGASSKESGGMDHHAGGQSLRHDGGLPYCHRAGQTRTRNRGACLTM